MFPSVLSNKNVFFCHFRTFGGPKSTPIQHSPLQVQNFCNLSFQIVSEIIHFFIFQSSKVAWNIYCSKWYDQTEKIKKIMLMMMKNSKPLSLEIGPFNKMSLEAFIGVRYLQTRVCQIKSKILLISDV